MKTTTARNNGDGTITVTTTETLPLEGGGTKTLEFQNQFTGAVGSTLSQSHETGSATGTVTATMATDSTLGGRFARVNVTAGTFVLGGGLGNGNPIVGIV